MRVFDAFTFYNELDLLEIRLATLNDVVDYFVLVEATKTFQKSDKPLYFSESSARFSKYLHKIIHVVVDDMPDSDDPFVLEAYQRNAIARGLTLCNKHDRIIISDVDEIPRPEKVKLASAQQGIKAFRQKLYYYYVNCECVELNNLPYSVMCSYGYIVTPQDLRQLLVETDCAVMTGNPIDERIELIEDAGWHFSYLGGVAEIINKIKAFSHVEYNEEKYLSERDIEYALTSGADLFGRDYHFNYVKLDDSFPLFLRNNISRFSHLIRI